jgi:hypothetical protein
MENSKEKSGADKQTQSESITCGSLTKKTIMKAIEYKLLTSPEHIPPQSLGLDYIDRLVEAWTQIQIVKPDRWRIETYSTKKDVRIDGENSKILSTWIHESSTGRQKRHDRHMVYSTQPLTLSGWAVIDGYALEIAFYWDKTIYLCPTYRHKSTQGEQKHE